MRIAKAGIIKPVRFSDEAGLDRWMVSDKFKEEVSQDKFVKICYSGQFDVIDNLIANEIITAKLSSKIEYAKLLASQTQS